MSLPLSQIQAIALNRFGLGARPDEPLPADPKAWLLGQFDRFEVRPAAYAALPAPGSVARAYLSEGHQLENGKESMSGGMAGSSMPVKQVAGAAPATPPPTDLSSILKVGRPDIQQALGVELRESYRAGVNARMASAIMTTTPFVERLANFWSNHFALSVEKAQVSIFAAAYETDAIRPHVLGKFEDMLVAVEHHPAMLNYLDQYVSVGPNSGFGQSAEKFHPELKIGLNENLAREIMELHTLGVRSGYTQGDVTEFARALTGWTIAGLGFHPAPEEPRTGGFVFRDFIHEPGDRTIIGKHYPAAKDKQAMAVLHDLAAAPATARHISTKLARHFVADNPPPLLVDRMTQVFVDSGGHLPAVYRVMVEAPEAWSAASVKFKTPWDWAVSSLRGIGGHQFPKTDFASMMALLGQAVWKPGSPAGYDDMSASWAAPDALMARLELAQRFAAQAGEQIDARALAARLLPGMVSTATATAAALAQADSGPTALALLLVSPEFQRR